MKNLVRYGLLIMSFLFYTINAADAQQKSSKKHSSKKSHSTTKAKSTTPPAKSLDDATTGVMGKDTVKMNSKGQTRNLNQGSNLPLPPNSGNGYKK